MFGARAERAVAGHPPRRARLPVCAACPPCAEAGASKRATSAAGGALPCPASGIWFTTSLAARAGSGLLMVSRPRELPPIATSPYSSHGAAENCFSTSVALGDGSVTTDFVVQAFSITAGKGCQRVRSQLPPCLAVPAARAAWPLRARARPGARARRVGEREGGAARLARRTTLLQGRRRRDVHEARHRILLAGHGRLGCAGRARA